MTAMSETRCGDAAVESEDRQAARRCGRPRASKDSHKVPKLWHSFECRAALIALTNVSRYIPDVSRAFMSVLATMAEREEEDELSTKVVCARAVDVDRDALLAQVRAKRLREEELSEKVRRGLRGRARAIVGGTLCDAQPRHKPRAHFACD